MGPLKGVKVIELVARGPGPFCGQMLADMGAEVVCVERLPLPRIKAENDVSRRGKASVALDLKRPEGLAVLLDLIKSADVFIEGLRPGATERLGVGPEACATLNPRLVYGRATGWGQSGPLAQTAGHDLNYIAITGALHGIGPADRPPPAPLNLVGDIGGGGMMLSFGIVAALFERERSGLGQVVDAAMTDGVALMMGQFFTRYLEGVWTERRGENFADGGSHYCGTYQTKDFKYVAVSPITPNFYDLFVETLGLDPARFGRQNDRTQWAANKRELTDLFLTRTRDEWAALFDGSDACVTPVLSLPEAPAHPHNVARQTFVDLDGMTQPAPAPRFSRTAPTLRHRGRDPGADTLTVLADLGYSPEALAALKAAAIIPDA
jgi:alpha-methylacyl-CoA racemase